MKMNSRLAAALIGVGLSASPMAAAAEEARFDFVMLGVSAGTLNWSGEGAPGGSYSVTGRLKTSGMAALLKKVRYDAKVSGSIAADGSYQPVSYSEDADTGRRQSQSQISYANGVPTITRSQPERKARPYDISPADQGGKVDPLTAMFAILRDVAPGGECNRTLQIFDGRRASQVSTGTPQAKGDTVVCTGEYRRIAGFSADDMAEKTRFPFTLTYAPGPDGKMRVVEVAMESLYGKARLVRQ